MQISGRKRSARHDYAKGAITGLAACFAAGLMTYGVLVIPKLLSGLMGQDWPGESAASWQSYAFVAVILGSLCMAIYSSFAGILYVVAIRYFASLGKVSPRYASIVGALCGLDMAGLFVLNLTILYKLFARYNRLDREAVLGLLGVLAIISLPTAVSGWLGGRVLWHWARIGDIRPQHAFQKTRAHGRVDL